MLQGLQGTPIAELCHAHQISPSLYDPWRDPFLTQADKACEVHQRTRRRVGEWRLEFKKSDERLPVNKKRMLRVMREHPLLVRPNLQRTAKRTPSRHTPQPTQPHEWGPRQDQRAGRGLWLGL